MAQIILDHALALQETVSFNPGSPCGTPTPPYYLSVATPRNVIDQLDMGRSQASDVDREKIIVLLMKFHVPHQHMFL